jgi:prepilin-type N-terminal cleavage/methylation domain-containing protein
MKLKLKNKKAFTLIELLVVVLIIGILAAIALPQYQKTIEKSRFTKAKQNLSTLYRSAQAYQLLHGNFPTSLADLDVSFSGESTDIPSSITGILTNDDKIIVDGFTYGILNSEDAWTHAPFKTVFAYYKNSCTLLIGKYIQREGHLCICQVGNPRGELAKKYCGDIMQGALFSENFGGNTVYTLP